MPWTMRAQDMCQTNSPRGHPGCCSLSPSALGKAWFYWALPSPELETPVGAPVASSSGGLSNAGDHSHRGSPAGPDSRSFWPKLSCQGGEAHTPPHGLTGASAGLSTAHEGVGFRLPYQDKCLPAL